MPQTFRKLFKKHPEAPWGSTFQNNLSEKLNKNLLFRQNGQIRALCPRLPFIVYHYITQSAFCQEKSTNSPTSFLAFRYKIPPLLSKSACSLYLLLKMKCRLCRCYTKSKIRRLIDFYTLVHFHEY